MAGFGDLVMRIVLDTMGVDRGLGQARTKVTYFEKVMAGTANRFMSSFIALFSLQKIIQFGKGIMQLRLRLFSFLSS